MKQQILNFLNTPLGSFTKGFITILLSMWAADIYAAKNIFIPIDKDYVSKLVIAATTANIHWIANWFNPNYVQYGITKSNKEIAKIERGIEEDSLNT